LITTSKRNDTSNYRAARAELNNLKERFLVHVNGWMTNYNNEDPITSNSQRFQIGNGIKHDKYGIGIVDAAWGDDSYWIKFYDYPGHTHC
jgi:hypothetical protein